MTHFLQMQNIYVPRKYTSVFLALFWVLGFVCGMLLSLHASFASLMPVIFMNHLSIVDILLSSLTPLFFFAFAVYISNLRLLYVFSFIRALAVSFVFCLIFSRFGEAGWLLGFLYCFRSLMLLPVFFWYTLHSVSSEFRFSRSAFLLTLAVCVIVTAMDFAYILPLAGGMFDYLKG